MEVWDWWPFIIRRRKTIVLVMVLTVAVTMAVTFVLPAVYRSVAIMYVQPMSQEQVLAYPSASQLTARNSGELVKSLAVTRAAAEALGKADLEGEVDYRVPENTGLVEVLVDAQSPQLAADEANAIADAFIAYNASTVSANASSAQAVMQEQLKDLQARIEQREAALADARSQPGGEALVQSIQDEIDTLKTGYEGVLSRWQALPAAQTLLATSIHVADRALPDDRPVSPRPLLNLILAVVAGIMFGVAVARMADGPSASRNAV